jgi:hypothetical protein
MSIRIRGGALLYWVAVVLMILLQVRSIGVVVVVPRLRMRMSVRGFCLFLPLFNVNRS